MEAVEAGYEKVSANRDEVFLVSLSFGSALALDFAARYPERVAGLVALAGFVYTRDPRRFMAPLMARILKSLPAVGNDIADPDQREIAYERLPAAAGYSMLRFATQRARRALPQVTCPILVMHGRQDHTVPPASSQVIYDSVGSTDKELVWLERSYHVITLDYERDQVFQRTLDFVRKHSRHAV